MLKNMACKGKEYSTKNMTFYLQRNKDCNKTDNDWILTGYSSQTNLFIACFRSAIPNPGF